MLPAVKHYGDGETVKQKLENEKHIHEKRNRMMSLLCFTRCFVVVTAWIAIIAKRMLGQKQLITICNFMRARPIFLSVHVHCSLPHILAFSVSVSHCRYSGCVYFTITLLSVGRKILSSLFVWAAFFSPFYRSSAKPNLQSSCMRSNISLPEC